MNEYTQDHYDFEAKLQSIIDCFSEPFDEELVELGVQATFSLRKSMWRASHFRRFMPVVRAARRSALRMNDRRSSGALAIHEAGLLEALGDWGAVLEITSDAGQLITLEMSEAAKAELLVYEGAALHNLGKHKLALEKLSAASKYADEETLLAHARHKLHRTLKALGRNREAAELLDSVFPMVPENDQYFLAELCLDKASMFTRTDPEQALSLSFKAKSLCIKSAFSRGLAYANLQCGRAYLQMNNYRRAEKELANARAEFVESGYVPGQTHVRYEQGVLQYRLKNFELASELFKEASDLAESIGYSSAAFRAKLQSIKTSVSCRRPVSALRLVVEIAPPATAYIFNRLIAKFQG